MASETHLDMSKSTSRADDALMALYHALREKNAAAPGAFTTLTEDGRRAYFREAKQRNRQKQREAAETGRLEPTAANVRAALADAALMLLATDGPGADQVRVVLASVFAARPGVPLTIEQRAKAGKIRPKLVRPGQ